MTFANLLVDDGAPVRTVTVNRPKVLNALDGATLDELFEAFGAIAAAPEVRVVILTGAGEKAFAAGADIAAMAGIGVEEGGALAARGHRLSQRMEGMAAPIIAAVNGFALGGGLELALACDFIIAATTARLGQPEVSVGVVPGFGGTQRLPRRIGVGRARQLLYTGDLLTAADARAAGLVNEVVEPAELMPRTRAIAGTIATRAPLAVAYAKRAVREGEDLPLDRGLALEQELFAALFGTADQKEGMRAFLEKRPPRWSGK
jgi:enoyl-CoA hydratase